MNDFDILKAFIGEQLEHEVDQRFARVFWHGEDKADEPCMEPSCPCGTSSVEGPQKPLLFRGIIQ